MLTLKSLMIYWEWVDIQKSIKMMRSMSFNSIMKIMMDMTMKKKKKKKKIKENEEDNYD